MIEVYTRIEADENSPFWRIKRTRWAREDFVVSGEWSSSAYHQGYVKFNAVCSKDGKRWGLKEIGFPTRIVATARVTSTESQSVIVAAMMSKVRDAGGSWIEFADDFGAVDEEIFTEEYW